MDPVTVFSLIAGAGIIVLLAMFGFFVAYTYLAVRSYDPDDDAEEDSSEAAAIETGPMDDPFDLMSHTEENGDATETSGENGGFVFSDTDQ